MELGKVSENILDRSVLKKITVDKGASIYPKHGTDCGTFAVSCENMAVATATFDYSEGSAGQVAVMKAVNNLLASGFEPVGVTVNVSLAPRMREIKLKNIMEQVNETCLCFNIPVLGGHTCVSDALNRQIVSATAIGRAIVESPKTPIATAGMELVATKWIGLTGTSLIAEKYKEKLCSKLPETLVDKAIAFIQYISVAKEAKIAGSFENSICHDVSEGGIFQALWEMSAATHKGFEVDIKRIPVKQETIEVCEFFGVNPYELESSGSMLIATDCGEALVLALQNVGIQATVIGRLTDNNDKVIINCDEKRFLDSSRVDALYRVKQEEL